VAQTREFLVRLASPYGEGAIKGIRREVRAEALRLLRHYPLSWNGDFPTPDNAARPDNDERLAALQALEALDEELSVPRRTPATHATPSDGSVQDGCTLTDEERAAIEAAARIVDEYDDEMDGFPSGAAATLRRLLERLG
jgi:hypothetical protein